MTDQFGKILQSIYDSTLMADRGKDGCWVFASMVILSDKRGVLNIVESIFAKRIGVTVDELMEEVKYLESPDPNSNIKAHEGRRIIPLSDVDDIEENRGVLVVNKRFYALKDSPKSSVERVGKHRKKEQILNIFNELGVCNVTETLPKRIVTILSIYISTSISIEVIKYLIESNLDLYAWAQFEDYRKNEIKAPLKTDKGRKSLINFLAEHTKAEQRKIIKKSIDQEWKGLFPLDEQKCPSSKLGIFRAPCSKNDHKGIDKWAASLGVNTKPFRDYFDLYRHCIEVARKKVA